MIPKEYEILAGIAAILTLMLLSAFGTYKFEEYKWTAALADQKIEAANVMAEQVATARTTEHKATKLSMETEARNAQSIKNRNAQLDNAHSTSLRDPGRGESSSCTQASTTRPANGDNGSSSGAELSRPATEFLQRQANICDRVVDQYLNCQAYAIGLHKICQ